jgi:sulfoxide reductase heme-binding subunit YedZ
VTFKTLNEKLLTGLKVGVFMLALMPLSRLLYAGWHDALGANPIEKITHNTGYWTLTFLLTSLTPTPLRQLTGMLWPIRLRRMLGLFAFFYACLHFLSYLVLDQFFDWANIIKDISKRPYITIGFSAFVALIPLAVTSNNSMQRKLGGKRWRQLHRLVYPIAIAGVIHFAWLVKKDLSGPLVFACILVLLLAIRIAVLVRVRVVKRTL